MIFSRKRVRCLYVQHESLRQAASLELPFHGENCTHHANYTRSLSLQNMVLGYAGRAFPAGLGQDASSKDATSWLCTRFGRSVGTRRRFGWLRMVYTRRASSQAPIWCPPGRWPCRGKFGKEPQHAQAYRGTFYRVSKHWIRRGRRAARSSTTQRSAEPLCSRIKGANRG